MRCADVAAEPRELVPDLGDRPSGIVAQGGDQYRDTTGPVTLVCHLGVVNSFQLPGALLDGALDVVLRHRAGPRRVDRGPESRVVSGIPAAQLCRHRDLTNQLGELRPTLGVGGRLVVLDLLPFTMAGHILLG